MNATIRPEEIESIPEVDSNLAAVSEVEAGIRDFVRNDVAYLRRPVPGEFQPYHFTLPDRHPWLREPAREDRPVRRSGKPRS